MGFGRHQLELTMLHEDCEMAYKKHDQSQFREAVKRFYMLLDAMEVDVVTVSAVNDLAKMLREWRPKCGLSADGGDGLFLGRGTLPKLV